MKKLSVFKLRAECLADINALTPLLLKATYLKGSSARISFTVKALNLLPDCEMEFKTNLSLNDIRKLITEIPDGHVMLESVNLKVNYTGDRYFRM